MQREVEHQVCTRVRPGSDGAHGMASACGHERYAVVRRALLQDEQACVERGDPVQAFLVSCEIERLDQERRRHPASWGLDRGER